MTSNRSARPYRLGFLHHVRRALIGALVCMQVCVAHSGKTMKIENPTSAQKAMCEAYLVKMGMPLPPGAEITGIEISSDTWTCPHCDITVEGIDAKWPNKAAQCDNCGGPMDPTVGQMAGQGKGKGVYKDGTSTGSLHLSEEQITAALTMGSNWTCDSCGNAGNYDMVKIKGKLVSATECTTCGAQRPGSSIHGGKNHQAAKRSNPTAAEDAGVRLSDASRQYDSRDFRHMLLRDRKGKIIGGGIVALAASVSIFSAVTLGDVPTSGKVTGAKWVQTVEEQQFQPTIEKAKKSQIKEAEPVMPVNGANEKAGAKILDCEGEVCRYETYKWITVDSREKRGGLDEPPPPDESWAHFVEPSNGKIRMVTRFDVDFEFDIDGEHYVSEWRPLSLDEAKRFKVGDTITVQLDSLKSVKSIAVQGGKK